MLDRILNVDIVYLDKPDERIIDESLTICVTGFNNKFEHEKQHKEK